MVNLVMYKDHHGELQHIIMVNLVMYKDHRGELQHIIMVNLVVILRDHHGEL